VNDAKRRARVGARFVRGVKPAQHPRKNGARDAPRNLPLSRVRCIEQARERLAVDVLHDQEELPLIGNHIECAHDVVVCDASRQARLVQEHRDEARVLGQVRMQPLDGHGLRKSTRGEDASQVHARHATGGELRVDDVPTQLRRQSVVRHPEIISSGFAPGCARR
jgi:hypothetical protein